MCEDQNMTLLMARNIPGQDVCIGVFESHQEFEELSERINNEDVVETLAWSDLTVTRSADHKRLMKLPGKSCLVPAIIMLCVYITKNHQLRRRYGSFFMCSHAYEDAAEAVKAREEWLADPDVLSVELVTVQLYERTDKDTALRNHKDILHQLQNAPYPW